VAFPIPPPPRRIPSKSGDGDGDGDGNNDDDDDDWVASPSYDVGGSYYHAEGWVAVLEQLAGDLEINAVRVYDMDCRLDYSAFLGRAAELGVYVIVPFTGVRGGGVLDRNGLPPPPAAATSGSSGGPGEGSCYPPALYRYGRACADNFARYPNVLAGTVGNEVMNSLAAWPAAPCVRAYARDLKAHMRRRAKQEREVSSSSSSLSSPSSPTGNGTTAPPYRVLPLLYAAQNDSPEASVPPEAAMRLTAGYLTCVDDEGGEGEPGRNRSGAAGSGSKPRRRLGRRRIPPDVDLYGINVESWCSSLQTFELNEDGSEPGYHALYRSFENASFPVVFTEVGCSKPLFNRDNGLPPRGERDWRQVPVILNRMNPVFSGFSAYAYDGNPLFRMMDGRAPWDGVHPLPPSQDYENFREQLRFANQQLRSGPALPEEEGGEGEGGGSVASGNPVRSKPEHPLMSCSGAAADLRGAWGLDLAPLGAVPSYVDAVPDDGALPRRAQLPPPLSPPGAGGEGGGPPPAPDRREAFPGPGGLTGIRASLAVMLAGLAIGLGQWLSRTGLCRGRGCGRRRLSRRGSSNRSASPASQDGGPHQQVSLLERPVGNGGKGGNGGVPSYGTLTPGR
jgi:hypothetical protein